MALVDGGNGPSGRVGIANAVRLGYPIRQLIVQPVSGQPGAGIDDQFRLLPALRPSEDCLDPRGFSIEPPKCSLGAQVHTLFSESPVDSPEAEPIDPVADLGPPPLDQDPPTWTLASRKANGGPGAGGTRAFSGPAGPAPTTTNRLLRLLGRIAPARSAPPAPTAGLWTQASARSSTTSLQHTLQ